MSNISDSQSTKTVMQDLLDRYGNGKNSNEDKSFNTLQTKNLVNHTNVRRMPDSYVKYYGEDTRTDVNYQDFAHVHMLKQMRNQVKNDREKSMQLNNNHGYDRSTRSFHNELVMKPQQKSPY